MPRPCSHPKLHVWGSEEKERNVRLSREFQRRSGASRLVSPSPTAPAASCGTENRALARTGSSSMSLEGGGEPRALMAVVLSRWSGWIK